MISAITTMTTITSMTETETETEFIHNILKPGVKIEERVDGHLQTNADPTMRPHFQTFGNSER